MPRKATTEFNILTGAWSVATLHHFTCLNIYCHVPYWDFTSGTAIFFSANWILNLSQSEQ
jgi:hypothetical protein